MTIGIIGGGNMGSAMAQAFISKNISKAENITIVDPDEAKRIGLEAELEIKTSENSNQIVESDIILLAVKPQQFESVAQSLSGAINTNSIVISIMAGVTITNISSKLQHEKIVRAMPNTPALLQAGVTGWYATKSLSTDEKITCNDLLSSCGFAFEVNSEEEIDTITALTGSGPGFFFAITEAWVEASETLPLKRQKQQELILKMMMGSLLLANTSEKPLSELREMVTSKGGTTAAGLEELDKAHLKETFSKMLNASYKRCKELNS